MQLPGSITRQLAWLLALPGRLVQGGCLAGAVLLAWSAGIHLDLYASSYSSIPTIGPLFLLQGIVGVLLAVALVTFRRPLLALVGSGFALSTVAGLLLSVNVGLFGFKDSFLAPFATESLVMELVAAGVLGVVVVMAFVSAGRSATAPLSGSGRHAEVATPDQGAAAVS